MWQSAAENEKVNKFLFVKWKNGIHSILWDKVPKIRCLH